VKKQSEVRSKEIIPGCTTTWLSNNDGEFFTVREVAVLLGVEVSNIRHIIKRDANSKTPKMSFVTPSHVTVKKMRDYRLCAQTGRVAKLIPLDTVDKLVKIVNTSAAWDMYSHLLEAIRSPKVQANLQTDILGAEGAQKFSADMKAYMDTEIKKVRKEVEQVKLLTNRFISKNTLKELLRTIHDNKRFLTKKDKEWLGYMVAATKTQNCLSIKQINIIKDLYSKVI